LPGLILLASTSGLGVGVARVVTSFYAVELRASEFELGLIAGAQSIGIVFMSLPMGILVQRYGSRLLYVTGGILGGIVFCLTPLVAQTWFLILCTVLGSFVMPARFVALNTVFLSKLETVGAKRAGWFRATHMLGFLLVAPTLAVFLHEHFDYLGAFVGIGLIFFLPVLLSPLAIAPHTPAPGPLPRLDGREIFAQLRLLFAEPELRRTSWFEFLTQAIIAYFGFFAVVIAIQVYKADEANAAWLLTAEGAFFVAALFLTGGLISRLGKRRAYRASFLLLAASLAVLSQPVPYPLFWAASSTMGIALAMIYIVNFITYGDIGKRIGMGRISAISALIGPAGGFLGSILGGLLGSLWELQTIFLPLGALSLLCWRTVGRANAAAITEAHQTVIGGTEIKEVS
jgi:MFS family permease